MRNYLNKLVNIHNFTYFQNRSIQKYRYSNAFCSSMTIASQCIFKKDCNTVTLSDNEKEWGQEQTAHIPVLCTEVGESLNVKAEGVYLDMTFGAGGHTRMILEKNRTVKVYGLDRDPLVKQFADDLKGSFPNQFYSLNGKFSDLPQLLYRKGIGRSFFDGVIMDLGPSSMQFDNPGRGFMLSKDGPLDMRMDGRNDTDTPTASQILKYIDEDSLYKVLKYYGQEKRARPIARAIVESRMLFKSLNTTKELAELVASMSGDSVSKDKLQRFSHPATKTFLALRILVNDELNQLECGIRLAHYFLKTGGILAAISFHSLEDTILKRHIIGVDLGVTSDVVDDDIWKHGKSHLCNFNKKQLLSNQLIKPWNSLTKHVITPTEQEVKHNPRARSAKLRIASKSDVSGYSSIPR